VCNFNNPPSGSEIRISLLLPDFFTALLYVRNVKSIFDNLLRRFSSISFVGAQMLANRRALNHDSIKNRSQLSDIMPICSCYDYRERDPNLVHKDMPLASFFFPCPLDCDQRIPRQEALLS
jgi:hypothetical protein